MSKRPKEYYAWKAEKERRKQGELSTDPGDLTFDLGPAENPPKPLPTTPAELEQARADAPRDAKGSYILVPPAAPEAYAVYTTGIAYEKLQPARLKNAWSKAYAAPQPLSSYDEFGNKRML